jgi:hypothetical protein
MKFPKMYKALRSDDSRPAMQYAIVEDGKIVASNGHIMVFSDFGCFVENPGQAEGKVFDKELLKWMSDKSIKRLECRETGIAACRSQNGWEEKPYSGYLQITKTNEEETNPSCDIHLIYLSKNKDGKEIGRFPDWKSAIPDKRSYEETEGLKNIGFDAGQLNTIAECFIYGTQEPKLKFEFWENDRAILVSPANEPDSDKGIQAAILMPVSV